MTERDWLFVIGMFYGFLLGVGYSLASIVIFAVKDHRKNKSPSGGPEGPKV